ncbi:MAG: hypothetical protein AAB037_01805 [Chloroflexota bacterium]
MKRLAFAVVLAAVLMLALAGSVLARGPADEACTHTLLTPAGSVLDGLVCQSHP